MFALMDFSAREPSEAHSAKVDCFFGRRIAAGGLREELKKYSLKQRFNRLRTPHLLISLPRCLIWRPGYISDQLHSTRHCHGTMRSSSPANPNRASVATRITSLGPNTNRLTEEEPEPFRSKWETYDTMRARWKYLLPQVRELLDSRTALAPTTASLGSTSSFVVDGNQVTGTYREVAAFKEARARERERAIEEAKAIAAGKIRGQVSKPPLPKATVWLDPKSLVRQPQLRTYTQSDE